MNLLRPSALLCFASTLLLFSCGSGSGATNTVALCNKTCDKLSSLCFADAGAFGDSAKTTCMSSCTTKTTSTGTTTCTNASASLAAYQACVDRVDTTCDQFTTCLAAGLTAEESLLNGMSKAADVASGGRHMSNHFAKPEIGIQNVSSAVSNHAQHAAGLARAVKTYGSDAIVYCSIGESSAS